MELDNKMKLAAEAASRMVDRINGLRAKNIGELPLTRHDARRAGSRSPAAIILLWPITLLGAKNRRRLEPYYPFKVSGLS
jgi:hypothetical protein